MGLSQPEEIINTAHFSILAGDELSWLMARTLLKDGQNSSSFWLIGY